MEDMGMKVREGEFDDYRRYTEYTFKWEKVQPVKLKSILEQIYQKELLTYGDKKFGISIDRKSLIQVTFEEGKEAKL